MLRRCAARYGKMQVRSPRAWIALRMANNHLCNQVRRAVVRAAALL
jgi:hypothetical protein